MPHARECKYSHDMTYKYYLIENGNTVYRKMRKDVLAQEHAYNLRIEIQILSSQSSIEYSPPHEANK